MLSFLLPLLTLIKNAIKVINEQLFDETGFNGFLRSRGWDSNILESDMPLIHSTINISTSINSLIAKIEAIENENSPIEQAIEDVIPQVISLFNEIRALKNTASSGFSLYPLNQQEFWNELGDVLFDDFVINFIEKKSRVIFTILHVAGIIEYKWVVPTNTDRLPYMGKYFKWEELGDFIINPVGVIKDYYNWGKNKSLDYESLFSAVERILSTYSIPVKKNLILKSEYDQYFNGFLNNNIAIYGIEIPLFQSYDLSKNGLIKISIKVIPAPSPSNNNLYGFYIIPEVMGAESLLINISPELHLKGTGYFSSNNVLAFKLTPEEASLDANLSNLPSVFNAAISFLAIPAYPWLILGNESASRLMCAGFEASVAVRGAITDPEFLFRIGTGDVINKPNFLFVYDPSSNDNFIKKILGTKPLNLTFGIGIIWSSKSGIGFEGNGGLSFTLPLSKNSKSDDSKFPIRLTTLRLNAQGGTDDSNISLGVDFDFDLSVIKASVRDIGIKVALIKKTGTQAAGIFNGLDVDFDFKFPTGVGLAIDAPPVSGGGFLNYDEATSTYTGGLELNFSKISFSAIGIISTKLPGGEDGYSLLIIITAEFGPLPIGMGFTLNGLGGLMGLNRTMNPEFLREGIKNNTLDSILFPHDIVKNANTIISNIGQAFPILKDQFVIGPMAKIGWGTPTLITIELGIMIELPNPVRLAILGVLKAILPTESKPVLQLQVNFLGIIDFDNKYISFDASLYDSKILTFGLFGDMALRLYWGDEPNFLLSVGGFHPKFTPPPLDLPTMRRLTIVLANESDLKISVETYFAVTSNSVQFGAKVAAMAKAWKIKAIGALWFDILFQFSPFHFIADMGAMFAIKMGSKTILSLFIDLSLEGPHPWKAQGRGSFKILFVKVSVSFNKTFGSANVETIAPVAIDDKFTDAVKSKDNWEAILADRNNQQVACREIAGYQQDLLIVDPGGSLRFSQNLVPLDTKIEKFGNSAISDYNKYSIATANHGFTLSPAQDYFARNSFFYLSDDDKLSRPSYELFNSGIIAGATALVSRFAVHRLCEYEQITLDSGYRELKPVWEMLESVFDVHVFENYVSRAQIAQFDKIPTEKGWPGTVQLNHDDDDFVLVNRNNLEQAIPQSFSSSVEAERVLQENRNTQPGVASEWIVANRFELEL